jgi:hypothetical protein
MTSERHFRNCIRSESVQGIAADTIGFASSFDLGSNAGLAAAVA